MRILLAEDDPQLGRATQIGLEQGGMQGGLTGRSCFPQRSVATGCAIR